MTILIDDEIAHCWRREQEERFLSRMSPSISACLIHLDLADRYADRALMMERKRLRENPIQISVVT